MPRTRPSHDDCNYCNPTKTVTTMVAITATTRFDCLKQTNRQLQLEYTYVRLNLKRHPLNTRYLAAIAITFTRLLSRG